MSQDENTGNAGNTENTANIENNANKTCGCGCGCGGKDKSRKTAEEKTHRQARSTRKWSSRTRHN